MTINRGYDDPRQLGRSSVEALRADKSIDPILASDLHAYEEISRTHYTGDFDRIEKVKGAYRRIAARVPFHAEELIGEYFNAQVRRSIIHKLNS